MIGLTLPAALTKGWNTILNAALQQLDTNKMDNTSMVPPVGYSAAVPFILTTGTTAATYTTQYFYPYDVGPAGWTTDAAVVNIVTAYSGTTTPTIFAGLYASDPATGYPNTASLLAQGSTATTSTGVKVLTWASPVTLAPGRYWISTLLAGGAVSTAGAITCIATSQAILPITAAAPTSTVNRGLQLVSRNALISTATASNGFAINSSAGVTIAQLRRSA